jgi:hypothetical protein
LPRPSAGAAWFCIAAFDEAEAEKAGAKGILSAIVNAIAVETRFVNANTFCWSRHRIGISPAPLNCALEIGLLSARRHEGILNRHVERVFNPDRKEHHWGRRKLARDR